MFKTLLDCLNVSYQYFVYFLRLSWDIPLYDACGPYDFWFYEPQTITHVPVLVSSLCTLLKLQALCFSFGIWGFMPDGWH